MSQSEAFCIDCMEYMRTMPDNAFDLAVVDPPYGTADETEENAKRELGAHFVGRGRSKKYAEIYEGQDARSQSVQVERERERERPRYNVTRTGGTWAEKYAKKSSRGTLPQRKSILMSFFASHAIKSSGVATTSRFRRRGAS